MRGNVLLGLVFLLVAAPGKAPPLQQDRAGAPRPAPAANTDIGVEDLEARLASDDALEAVWLKAAAITMMEDNAAAVQRAQERAAALARLRGRRLATAEPRWTDRETDALLAFLLIDWRRFLYDADFRAVVTPVLEDGVGDEVPQSARKRMMRHLSMLEFGATERISVAWGLSPRTSRAREVLFDASALRFGSTGRIRASIYSLNSAFFDLDAAATFLRAVHEMAPHRQLIVVGTTPVIDQLELLAAELPLHLIDSFGRRYTPWPRDPFAVATSTRGPVTLVVRPNLQAQREGDVYLAREIVQGLPTSVDADWGGVRWTLAPIPFHGGHMLTTPTATWLSVHTLVPRILELMGIADTIRTDELRRPEELTRFLASVATAAREFESVFGHPVEFIHRMPTTHEDVDINELLGTLIGGDGRDLDSLVTILPGLHGEQRALVGDLTLGEEALSWVALADFERVGGAYHLVQDGEALRDALRRAQKTTQARQLDAFLDSSARHLASRGLTVSRVPLLQVPGELIDPQRRFSSEGFLLTWNNVVIEHVDGVARAEGFASGLTAIDEIARATYATAGYELRYVPTLARSVLGDGGYRCASNHVRIGDDSR